MENLYNDPIVALASPPGRGAIAVIRLSGLNLLEHLRSLITHTGGRPLSPSPRVMQLINLHPFDDKKQILDSGLGCFFQGPHSFTGEDTYEIFPHGSPYIIETFIESCLRSGFRAAEPGEFSRRAFINGKIDLAQAEGIRGLTEARSSLQWLAAQKLSDGSLSKYINRLRKDLVHTMAHLEAQIDFPDEDDTSRTNRAAVRSGVERALTDLDDLDASFAFGRAASEGLRVALCGPPNAGKSSLLNSIVGHDRAIISPEAGTTRDYIEVEWLYRGQLIKLVDTAGIRETSQTIERQGIEKSLEQAEQADLILWLTPADASMTVTDHLKAKYADKILTVCTKIDISTPEFPADVLISSVSHEGIQELRSIIYSKASQIMEGIGNKQCFITNSRQKKALEEASGFLRSYLISDEAGAFEDQLAFELQQAAKALSLIVGEINHEQVLDEIFSEFCVGK